MYILYPLYLSRCLLPCIFCQVFQPHRTGDGLCLNNNFSRSCETGGQRWDHWKESKRSIIFTMYADIKFNCRLKIILMIQEPRVVSDVSHQEVHINKLEGNCRLTSSTFDPIFVQNYLLLHHISLPVSPSDWAPIQEFKKSPREGWWSKEFQSFWIVNTQNNSSSSNIHDHFGIFWVSNSWFIQHPLFHAKKQPSNGCYNQGPTLQIEVRRRLHRGPDLKNGGKMFRLSKSCCHLKKKIDDSSETLSSLHVQRF